MKLEIGMKVVDIEYAKQTNHSKYAYDLITNVKANLVSYIMYNTKGDRTGNNSGVTYATNWKPYVIIKNIPKDVI